MSTLGATPPPSAALVDDDATQLVGTIAEPGPALANGSLIGRYIVLEPLGAGGMGTVYRAYDPRLHREVAIKLLRAPRGNDTDAAQRRTLDEARAMARLSHPHVLPVFDVDTDAATGRVYIAMEYVPGQTLLAWSRAQPRSPHEVLAAFREAGRGLAAAHAAGLVHHDVKPQNILMGDDGRVRVMDFGLARGPMPPSSGSHEVIAFTPVSLGSGTPRVSGDAVEGTPLYMAPEQLRGSPVDQRGDIYGFCVAFYECLHGQPPFRAGSIAQLLAAKLAGAFVASPERRVPAWLDQILTRGLAADPAARFQSMTELLAVLGRDPDELRARRRRRAAIAGTGLLAVAAVGWGMQRRERPCGDATELLQSTWNPERAEQLRGAFAATERELAPDAAMRAIAGLDAYTSGWAAARSDACVAALEAHTASPELFARQATCFDRRRLELAALVGALIERTTPATVDTAVAAVTGLSDPLACNDVDALLAEPAPPSDPAVVVEVEQIGDALATLRGEVAADRQPELAERHAALIERARATGYDPILARALLAAGMVSNMGGDYGRAEAQLHEAYLAAVRGGDDETARGSALRMAFQVGYLDRRPAAAERWIEETTARLARPHVGSTARAELASTLSSIHADAGHFEDAERFANEAVRLLEAEPPRDPEALAQALENRAIARSYRGDQEGSLADFARSIEIRSNHYGPDHPRVAMVLTNRANVYNDLGRHADALADLERAERSYARTYGGRHPLLVALYTTKANTRRGLGDLAGAIRDVEHAIALDEASRADTMPGDVVALTNLGEFQREAGDCQAASAAYERALQAIRHADGDTDHPAMPHVLVGRAECQLATGHAPSIADLERAIASMLRNASVQAYLLARARFALARAVVSTEPARARGLAEEALATFATSSPSDERATQVRQWLGAHPLAHDARTP